MATRLNRWTLASAILDQIREHELVTASTSVTGTWPGAEAKSEVVFIESVEGQMENPVMVAGRRQRDDRFDITFIVRISDKATEEACMTRLEEVVGAVEEVVALAASVLEEIDGVVSVDAPEVDYFGREMQAGFVGTGQVIVPVHVRLT